MEIKETLLLNHTKKTDFKRTNKHLSKLDIKESFVATVAPVQIATKVSKNFKEKNYIPSSSPKKKSTLEERQGKSYPFIDSDVLEMLNDMLSTRLIELPEMKLPGQANHADDLNYCKYHCLIGHPIERCFVFKDKVIDLTRKRQILLKEEKVTVNQMSILLDSPSHTSTNESSLDILSSPCASINSPHLELEEVEINDLHCKGIAEVPRVVDTVDVGRTSIECQKNQLSFQKQLTTLCLTIHVDGVGNAKELSLGEHSAKKR